MNISLGITIVVLFILDRMKFVKWHIKNVIKLSVLTYVITLFEFSLEIS